MELDALLFGGGAAGLWLLDELTRRGCQALLLETAAIGSGQTIASQGILHGGMKYSLAGLLTASASSIRDMPALWRECLAGRREPNLSGTRVRADCCLLWQTESIGSRLGLWGAKWGLHVTPQPLAADERPAVLTHCPGSVFRLNEQVISPHSFLENLLARNRERILRIAPGDGCRFDCAGPGVVRGVHVRHPASGTPLELTPRVVILTAGGGNAELRRRVGLPEPVMQKRPLHMVMARGNLVPLNGHCIDGAKTRVTITSDTDRAGRTVWQIGGQISEEGVRLDAAALIARAAAELRDVLPGIDLGAVEFSTYRVDRAERATRGGKRPDTFQILEDGHVLTAWPTKLVLVPRLADELADRVADRVGDRGPGTCDVPAALAEWPRPEAAFPPWERAAEWFTLRRDSLAPIRAA